MYNSPSLASTGALFFFTVACTRVRGEETERAMAAPFSSMTSRARWMILAASPGSQVAAEVEKESGEPRVRVRPVELEGIRVGDLGHPTLDVQGVVLQSP